MSSVQQVIIDDRNGLVKYTGSWSQAGDGSYPEFNVTTSQPVSVGATLSVTFTGTSIAVYATLGSGNDTSCNINVDGQNTATFTSLIQETVSHHTQIYSATNLANGPEHTLNLNVTSISGTTLSSNMYIDYMMVTQSTVQGPTFYDDTNPAFVYSGSWSTGDGTEEDMMQTLHGSNLGSSVSLTFTGTYINVYGRLPKTTGLTSIAQFTVDNGPAFISEYPLPNSVEYDPISETSSNYRLYSNPFLLPGKHTLVITAQAANALWLDYAIVGTNADLSNAGDSVTTFPAPQGPTQTTTIILSTGGTPHFPTASGAATRPSSSSTHTSAIAGGIAGAICFVLVILGIAYYYSQRRRQWNSDPDVLVPREFPPYLGNVNTDSRHFHNDSANWSPATAASRQGQMREANAAMPFQYTHLDGASTNGSVHQVGVSTSGSVHQVGASMSGSVHQVGTSANGSAQWRHQDASENGTWRHHDSGENGQWRHQDAGGNEPLRHQDAGEHGPWRHQDVARMGGSVPLRPARDRKGARSDRYNARSSSLGSGPPLVHEDSGLRGLEVPTSEEFSRRAELPPLYSAE